MPANVQFMAGQGFVIQDLAGSGLGFFGDGGFGQSVAVGNWQGRSFITNGVGTTQGPEVDNVKYLNAASGILGQTGSGLPLQTIPNYQATLNIRFTYDTPIKVQNCVLRIYDRANIDSGASGVTTKVAQLIHPDNNQVANGSGSTVWATPAGSGATLALCPSPGPSGLYAGNGSNSLWVSTQHDFYVAISASPTTIGSKTQYGLWFSCDYL